MAKKHLHRNGTSFGTLETLQISSIVVKKVMQLNLEKLYQLAAFIILLRSKHTLSINIPASSCLCEICENASLMGKALNRLKEKDKENQKSDVDKDFVTYQLWVQEEGKIEKKTISNIKNEFEVIWKEKTMSLKKHIHRKRKQVHF